MTRYLRKANGEVRVAHAVAAFILHHAVKVQHKSTESSVIGIRQIVDVLVQGVASGTFIFNPCGVDEGAVRLVREQWIGQVAEELLQQRCYGIDIVVEVGWVPEVQVGRVLVEGVAQGVDV